MTDTDRICDQRAAEREAAGFYDDERVAELEAKVRELEAENAELRADAERYRWLASNFTRAASLDMSGMHTYTGIGRTIGRGLNVSGAIDAAMRQRAEQESEEHTCPVCGTKMSYCESCRMYNCYTCDAHGQCLCS